MLSITLLPLGHIIPFDTWRVEDDLLVASCHRDVVGWPAQRIGRDGVDQNLALEDQKSGIIIFEVRLDNGNCMLQFLINWLRNNIILQ